MALPIAPEARELLESALHNLDEAVRVVGLAALGLDPTEESGPPP